MNLKTIACGAFLTLSLAGCGTLIDMGGNGGMGLERRVYVNDAAPNDSLPGVIVDGGVYFVMHPGKQYHLKVQTEATTSELRVMRAEGDFYYGWRTLVPTVAGGVQTFALQPDANDSTRYYRAFLRSATGSAASRPQKVNLVPAAPQLANSFKVKLVLVRQLTNLSEADKPLLAQAILDSLAAVYSAYGVTIDGSYEILEPTLPPLSVEFGTLSGFPGTRVANTLYMYLVDSIMLAGQNSTLLGYAPREAFDFSTDALVMSIRGSTTGSVASKAASIAVTAGHELGHFFGLRHTTASELDRQGDFDKSNLEDGWASTPYCSGLQKRAAETAAFAEIRAPGGRHFCLRTAAAHSCACPDAGNLMFAYQCSVPGGQRTLVAEQRDFLRWNISLYQ